MRDDDRLVRAAVLRREGHEDELPGRMRRGELERLRSGAYVRPQEWAATPTQERIVLRARAVAARARGEPTFTHTTAAAIWGLPLFHVREDRVHVLQYETRAHKSRGDVVRHFLDLDDADTVEVAGLRVTTRERTVYDVIREATAETTLACADGALRAVAWSGHGRYDEDRAASFRAAVAERISDGAGSRGIRAARFVCAFADGRAQLPGESVSRLWMHRLGVDQPELQREVIIGRRRAFPDFCWPDRRRYGEFDGDAKYLDPALTGERSSRDILRSQRARESALTEATGWLPVRWSWEHLSSPQRFAAFLRAHGVLD